MCSPKKIAGFSLIELMIVIVIISVLISIALPSYQNQLIKSRRAEAQGALLELANALERQFTVKSPSTYQGSATGGVDTGAPLSSIFPSQVPINGNKKFYNLVITEASTVSYTIRAVPIAGTQQADDGYLELRSNGTRIWDRKNDGSDLAGW